jgi:two-component system, NtrC family, sensor histidine kinase HydH
VQVTIGGTVPRRRFGIIVAKGASMSEKRVHLRAAWPADTLGQRALGALRELLLPEPPSISPSLSQGARRRVFAKALRFRLVIAPCLALLALVFGLFEPTLWRRVTLCCAVTLLFGLAVVEWFRYRKLGLDALLLPLNLLLTISGQLLVVSATGGLVSPLFPAVLVLVLVSALIVERATLRGVFALVAPAIWTFAFVHTQGWPVESLIPSLFGGFQLFERGIAPYVSASLYTLILVVVSRVGRALQTMFEELYSEGMRERDRALVLHAEQSEALTTLAAEIAHELKNPLASVKGLASLVDKELLGKASERMAVLRQEVDRMQAILEEFLNFSRPLVPLSASDVSLRELAREVLRLHEGSALERQVELALEAQDEARVRCDERKIRQVLINLIQNALDASPASETLRVEVGSSAEGVWVRVWDRGPGVAPEIAARAFEVGVTTKSHGSGIGLAVARSLARQHGGDLSLRSEVVRGTVAELVLPRVPTEVAP